MTAPVAVLYLAWAPLGAEPLRTFLGSYRSRDAGTRHDLVVILNGVEDAERRAQLLAELEGVAHQLVELDRPVLDLVAYRLALARLPHRHACLLNSHSVILYEGWLELLLRALEPAGVGLAGASGSWASISSLARYQLHLRGPYAPMWPDHRATVAGFQGLEQERRPTGIGGLATRIHTARALAAMVRGHPPFPNPHLRSTAFAGERELLAALLPAALASKHDAHRRESGRSGLTALLGERRLETVVVAAGGDAYRAPEWPDSETFWQGEQRGLLVSDNQSRDYDAGSAERRLLLAQFAWGDRARVA